MVSVASQAVAVAAGGAGLLGATVALSRHGRLSLRYALGWMAVSAAITVAALLLWGVHPLGDAVGMTATGLMLAASTTFVVGLALQLSISISGLQHQVRDLSEANALLEDRLRSIEDGTADQSTGSSTHE